MPLAPEDEELVPLTITHTVFVAQRFKDAISDNGEDNSISLGEGVCFDSGLYTFNDVVSWLKNNGGRSAISLLPVFSVPAMEVRLRFRAFVPSQLNSQSKTRVEFKSFATRSRSTMDGIVST
jgi:hypothetical protein